MRPSERAADQLRAVTLETEVSKHAEGSCFCSFGDTEVLCTASVENKVPSFLRGTGKGWITAEYGMLPRATGTRTDREAAKGRQSGRTQEIQRLIGRALRAIARLEDLADLTIKVDCDVLQADGGTRTAAITGAYVALDEAVRHLLAMEAIPGTPLVDSVAAVSCGLVDGEACLDLDYAEDSQAQADANFVITGRGGLVEIQASAESYPFADADFDALLRLAKKGIAELTASQRAALGLAESADSDAAGDADDATAAPES